MGHDHAVSTRDRFPGLSDGWARLDGAAGTLMVDSAIDAMTDFMRSPAASNLGGTFAASLACDELVEGARETVGRLLRIDALWPSQEPLRHEGDLMEP